MIAEILLGTKFTLTQGKGKSAYSREYTVVDIEVTRGLVTGEVVRTEYVCEHDFCGQKIRSRHPIVTIQRALWGKV